MAAETKFEIVKANDNNNNIWNDWNLCVNNQLNLAITWIHVYKQAYMILLFKYSKSVLEWYNYLMTK